MPSSPRTPQSGRRSSGFDFSFTPMSLHSNGYSPISVSRSRKSSFHSAPSPATTRPISSHSRTGEFSFSTDFGGAGESGNGLGSLADELAEAWDEDGEVDEGTSGLKVDQEEEGACNDHNKPQPQPASEYHCDIGIGLAISPGLEHEAHGSQSPTRHTSKPKHGRKITGHNRPDYSDSLDHDDSSGILSSLQACIAGIERLAQQSTNSEADEICKTVSESLRDLGSQTDVESSTTRLVTAHTALTTQLTHQSRLLQTLAHPLLSPLSIPPDPSAIAPLIPLLTSLLLALPQPSPSALSMLHAYHSSTADLISTLSYLSDTLHMSRQTTTLAGRRLKAARETVGSMKAEMEAVEEGMRWVETGGWEERLAGREAAKFCGEVVQGFEEVCQGWRERLLEQGRRVEVGAG